MLTKAGAKLLDFGLAKLRQPGTVGAEGFSAAPTVSAGLTGEGAILGTLQYMAPEQLEGKDADNRTDIFAFGTTVYEMATGNKAFSGDSQASLITAIMSADPPQMSSLQEVSPPALDQIVKTCLSKEPDERWQSAGDVGRQVHWIIEGGLQPRISAPVVTPHRGPWRRAMPLVTAAAAIALIAGVVGRFTGTPPATPRSITRFVVTTPPDGPLHMTGDEPDVAISPDGRRIVYLSNPDGMLGVRSDRRLYVRDVDLLEPAPLQGTEGGHMPFFSPDGAWVGFHDIENTPMKVLALGGVPIRITETDNAYGGNWGPDDTIVFARGGRSGLWRVSAEGGQAQVLTTPESGQGELAHRWPEVLPNGRAVLFTAWSGSDESSHIAMVSLETGEVTTLLRGGSQPRYSATGHIIYAAGNTLQAVGFDLDRLELTSTNPIPVLENVNRKGANGAANYDLARDGSLVYVSGGSTIGYGVTLVWVDRQGGEIPLDYENRNYFAPKLSPDGERLAVHIEDRGNTDVWVSELARGTLRRLTRNLGADAFPLWTLDGEQIVFASSRGGSPGLFRMAADGTGEAEHLITIEEVRNLRPHGWSADGSTLVFGYRTVETGRDIGLLSLEGERTWQPLLQTEASERELAVSPDGCWIAYASDETGDFEVYVQRFPELGPERLVSTSGGQNPRWSRDGSELFYTNGAALIGVPVKTDPVFEFERETEVTVFEAAFGVGLGDGPPQLGFADVSPDGQRFLMLKTGTATDDTALPAAQIILVQNWFDELQRLVPSP